jgi:hypothetical protein
MNAETIRERYFIPKGYKKDIEVSRVLKIPQATLSRLLTGKIESQKIRNKYLRKIRSLPQVDEDIKKIIDKQPKDKSSVETTTKKPKKPNYNYIIGNSYKRVVSKVITLEGVKVEDNNLYCRHCDKDIKDIVENGADYCPYCGQHLVKGYMPDTCVAYSDDIL